MLQRSQGVELLISQPNCRKWVLEYSLRLCFMYISAAHSIPTTSFYWMLQNIHHAQTPFFAYDFARCRNNSIRFGTPKARLSQFNSLLMCLPRNTARRPSLNRNFLLQTASSTGCLGFRRELFQCVHRDTILERGLVRRVKEDPKM